MTRSCIAALFLTVICFGWSARAEGDSAYGEYLANTPPLSLDTMPWGDEQVPETLEREPIIRNQDQSYNWANAASGLLVTKQFGQAYAGSDWYANYILSAIQTADGGYFLLEYGRGAVEMSVIKVDRNGYVEWRRNVQYGSSDVPRLYQIGGFDSVKQAPDGGYVVVGYMTPGVSNPAGQGPADGFLIKFDAHGNKAWEVALGFEYGDFASAVENAPGGGFVVAGKSSPDGVDTDAFLAKVSDAGRVIWEKRYDGLGGVPHVGEGATDVEIDHGDRGFVLVGNTSCAGIGCGFLARTDSDGNLIQVVRSGLESDYIYRVARAPDDGYFLAGAGHLFPGAFTDAIVVKLDRAASVQWVARSGDGYSSDKVALGLDVAEDGIRVAGDTTPVGDNQHPCYFHVDWNGHMIGQECLPETGIWYVVRRTVDGGTVVGGPYHLPRSLVAVHDAYLLKFKEGQVPGFISGSVYEDGNLSCSRDADEDAAGFRMLKAVDENSNAYLVSSDESGSYTAAVPPGNYTVGFADEQQTPDMCVPGVNSNVSVSQDQTSGGNDFPVEKTCFANLELVGGDSGYACPSGHPIYQGTPCAGYDWTVTAKLQAQSIGWDVGARVCFNLPWTLALTDVSVLTSSGCSNWLLDSSTPNPSNYICVTKQLPGAPVGPRQCDVTLKMKIPDTSVPPWAVSAAVEAYCGAASATPPPPPQGGQLAKDLLYDTTQCSCDPNDMLVNPQGCGTGGAITGQELTYSIHFQNVGAGPAHDIVIRDSLDKDLEPLSLRLVSSSHKITRMQVEPDNDLVISFQGIELPPQWRDSPGSNGSVVFAIHPKKSYQDGTIIDNGAAIFFDSNPPVMTNRVSNTLYNGGAVPVADFRAVRRGVGFDFSYTGGSSDVSYRWNFGQNALPVEAMIEHPTGVTFSGSGPYPVVLTVEKEGCASATTQDVAVCSVWSTTAFEPPMGKPRGAGSMLPLKFRLYHQGHLVSSAAQLEAILASEHGWTPEQGCWPRARVLAGGQPLALAGGEQCFQFDGEGKLALNLKLDRSQFRPGQEYTVEVENMACALGPDNSSFSVKK
jgi:uncharacterized repeat protein (TIGR01451 family)